jgi:hypothetical protein
MARTHAAVASRDKRVREETTNNGASGCLNVLRSAQIWNRWSGGETYCRVNSADASWPSCVCSVACAAFSLDLVRVTVLP